MSTAAERYFVGSRPAFSGITDCHACHIIPLLPTRKRGWSKSSLKLIFNFCSLPPDEFKTATHSLANIWTLGSTIGPFFTSLNTWFDAVPVSTYTPSTSSSVAVIPVHIIQGVSNTYNIHSSAPCFVANMPPQVTFSTKTDLPLPDPQYLKIHAAVCRIIQWSGAYTYRAKMERGRC